MPSALSRSFLSHSWAISHPYVVHPLFITLFVAQPFFQGLNLYVLTGITAMVTQTAILQRDVVRRMLRLPVLPKNTNAKPVTFQESIDHLKKWFREQNQIAQERALKGRKW